MKDQSPELNRDFNLEEKGNVQKDLEDGCMPLCILSLILRV